MEIPLDEIMEIVRIPKSDINNSIKTFGSDGAFGFIGKFKNKRLGNYTMFTIELKNLILIRIKDKVYVFSCIRVEEFVNDVKSKL